MIVPDRNTVSEQVDARLEALEAEVAALRQENAQLRGAGQAQPDAHAASAGVSASRRTSRRGLLKTAVGVAAATVGAGALLDAQHGIALADGNEAATAFSTSGAVAVSVSCTAPSGTGIEANGPGTSEMADYWGVASKVTNGIGVRSESSNSTALLGLSESTDVNATAIIGTIASSNPGGFSSAIRGQNNGTGGLGLGVWGSQAGGGWGGYFTSVSGLGVNADGGTGTGVNASGATGVKANGATGVNANGNNVGIAASGERGGVFSGSIAQIQLAPGSIVGHPTTGAHQKGDIYVDSRASMFICTGTGDYSTSTHPTWGQFSTSSATTAARISKFAASQRGTRVQLSWRLNDAAGVVGFNLYAGSRRLNQRTISPHAGHVYRYTTRSGTRGPFLLKTILDNGEELTTSSE